MKHKFALTLILAAVMLQGSALAQPVVRNFTTSIYAVVTDPVRLSFAPDGTLYAGRDASGSGGGYGAAVKVHRIAPGGSPVTEFGNAAVSDPDALIVDAGGAVSGTPGAVLVGGVHNDGSTGKIVKFAADGTGTNLFGPNATLWNPTHFLFDSTGRLLVTENNNGRVLVTTGGEPSVLITLAGASYIAQDASGLAGGEFFRGWHAPPLQYRWHVGERQLHHAQGFFATGARAGRRLGHGPVRRGDEW